MIIFKIMMFIIALMISTCSLVFIGSIIPEYAIESKEKFEEWLDK